MNRLTIVVSGILLLGLVIGFIVGSTNNADDVNITRESTTITKNNCLADDCLLEDVEYPAALLPEEVVSALNQAILDEYKAYATYKSVTDTYGNIRPFIMISRAEQQHIASLQGIYEKYGIDIPENVLLNNIQSPPSIQEACTIGVEAEIDNINLYKNSLIPVAEGYPDIVSVFTNLMNASEKKHLPAFSKCD